MKNEHGADGFASQVEMKHILCVNAPSSIQAIDQASRELFGTIDEICIASQMELAAWWEYAKSLRTAGVKRILLVGCGWWLEEEPPPRIAIVVDHVACHLPNPLTGSIEARSGRAFVNMAGAYSLWAVDEAGSNISSTKRVVLWHTRETASLSKDEEKLAKSAGCLVASPCIAPLVISARAAGIEVSAKVMLFGASTS